MENKNTMKKLLKEEDSRVANAIKVLINTKSSLDQAQTGLIMGLTHQFIQLYDEDLSIIEGQIETAIKSLNDFAQKIRIQLKQ